MPRKRVAGYRPYNRPTAYLVTQTERHWGPKVAWRCVYCGRIATTVDHFRPLSQGGSDTRDNYVPACDRCNSSKMEYGPGLWMQTVGVPIDRQGAILSHVGHRETALADHPKKAFATRVTLDYSAARLLERPKGAV